MELEKTLKGDTQLLIYVQDPDGKNILTGNNSRTKVLLGKGEKRWELLNIFIGEEETSELALELDLGRGSNPGEEWEKGKVKVKVFR